MITINLLKKKFATSTQLVFAVIAATCVATTSNYLAAIVWGVVLLGLFLLAVFCIRGSSATKRLPSIALSLLIMLVGVAAGRFQYGPEATPLAFLNLWALSLALLQTSVLLQKNRVPKYRAKNIPGANFTALPKGAYSVLVVFSFVPVVMAFLSSLNVCSDSLVLIATLSFILYLFAVSGWILTQRRREKSAFRGLGASLAELKPVFALHWAGPPDSIFQVAMWLPYLKRLNQQFVVIVRTPSSFDKVAELAGEVPVVLATSARRVEQVLVPTVRAVFYTNNSDRNAHAVRFSKLTHIQLLHGDSEKSPSYNPVTAMFDRIYVAGQAAIDRYGDNGIEIPTAKFAIVGRPQVELVSRYDGPVRQDPPATLLYAPTWAGLYEDSSYSSLTHVTPLLERALARGHTIIFRPHPYAYRSPELKAAISGIHKMLSVDRRESGRPHVYGSDAETEMTLYDCFNASDIMVADVSSVISDFLYSGKPIGIMTGRSSTEELLEELPLAKVSYVLAMDQESWVERFDEMVTTDPLAEERHAIRAHYLGDIPAENYAQTFLDTASADLAQPSA